MSDSSIITQFENSIPFALDQFQLHSIQIVNDGTPVMVAAPTGAGKTIVGEFAIFKALNQPAQNAYLNKVFYTTPIKALSNQKYNDLIKEHGTNKIGLITGDTVVNSEAQIVVMTTEVLRNMIYANSQTLNGLQTVVMDEVHYLSDKSRGPVWEEVIIHLPEHVQLISLSATVSNAEEFASWLRSVRGECELVLSEKRPIALEQFILLSDDSKKGKGDIQLLTLYNDNGSVNEVLVNKMKKPLKKQSFERNRRPKGRRGAGRSFPNAKKEHGGRRVPTRVDVIKKLLEKDMLPAICFIFSRNGCNLAVEQLMRANIDLTNETEKTQIREFLLSEVESTMNWHDLEALEYSSFKHAVLKGVCAHHAGVVQIFKEAVEKLFEMNLVKVVFATETLALGVNMPARSVVIEKLTKYDGVSHKPITPGEFTQLTGRAGRRGKDTIGFAVVVDQAELTPFDVASLASHRVYPLQSSFMPSYNMAVNLLGRSDERWAKSVLRQSYAQFQTHLNSQLLEEKLRDFEGALSGYSQHLEFDDKGNPHKPQNTQNKQTASKWLGRYFKTRDRINQIERELKNGEMKLENEFDKICSILESFSYLSHNKESGYSLTDRGRFLAKINCEHELLFSEIILSDAFVNLSVPQLAGALSAFVSVSKTVGLNSVRRQSDALNNALHFINSTWEEIHRLENKLNIISPRAEFKPNFSLVESVTDHAAGASLSTVMMSFGKDVSLGDFIRCVRNVIDLASQIARNCEDEFLQGLANGVIDSLKTGIIALLDA